jgi:hypothetical protein
VKNKKNILKHIAYDKAYPLIQPSKNFIPDWFKQGTRFGKGLDAKNINVLPMPAGFKLCAAFTDGMMSGYIMPLPVDIAIKQTEAGPSITWSSETISPVGFRPTDNNETLPTPMGCSPLHFVWLTQHAFKIPKGYSALLSHPYNRFDLPFYTLTGVVDGEFNVFGGNIPVFFSNTFEGIIPAGTPMMQILLFKTENWISEIDNSIYEQSQISKRKSVNSSWGWYKNNIWRKKTYE